MTDFHQSLDSLIKLYGQPSALVDNFESSRYGYAIWGFQNTIKYNLQSTYVNEKKVEGDPFNILQDLLNEWLLSDSKIKSIGFLGYDIKNFLYPHLKFKIAKTKYPCLWFAQPQTIRKYQLRDNRGYETKPYLNLKQDILPLHKYDKIISKIKEELKKGNSYQINLTAQKIFTYDKISPFKIYLTIREFVKPAFGYFINTGDEQILSFSPEQFFNTNGSMIKSFPMKGTQARSVVKKKDNIYKNKLKNSEKDKAEHLMIVDLLRNDLGKICKTGSIKVQDLYNIQSFETIHHMVTKIFGEIKDGISEVDIIKAMFPGGSITGAPKESAMRIIDQLEDNNRHIYTGSAGYISNNGDMYFNICIRTLLKIHDNYEYGVGGGIVWDSDVKDEWNEAHQKSKILELL